MTSGGDRYWIEVDLGGVVGMAYYDSDRGTGTLGPAGSKMDQHSGDNGQSRVATFDARAVTEGRWWNLVCTRSDIFVGTYWSCFKGRSLFQ